MRVLTVGFWPQSPALPAALPAPLAAAQAAFLAWYGQHYQGRRLAWSLDLGGCVVKALGLRQRKELEVPPFGEREKRKRASMRRGGGIHMPPAWILAGSTGDPHLTFGSTT